MTLRNLGAKLPLIKHDDHRRGDLQAPAAGLKDEILRAAQWNTRPTANLTATLMRQCALQHVHMGKTLQRLCGNMIIPLERNNAQQPPEFDHI